MFMSWKTYIRCRYTMLYLWRSKIKFFLSFIFLSFTLLRKGLSSFCHNLGYMTHDFLGSYPSLISLQQCQDYIQIPPHQGFMQVPENELSSLGLHDKRFHHEIFPLFFLLIFNSKTQKLKNMKAVHCGGAISCLILLHMKLKSYYTHASHEMETMGETLTGERQERS